MSAGNRNRPAQAHQFTQHFSAVDNRQKPAAGFQHFRVIRLDRGGDYDNRHAFDIFSHLANLDGDAFVAQSFNIGVFSHVASGDIIAHVMQNFGNTAHPDPANAREMNAAN